MQKMLMAKTALLLALIIYYSAVVTAQPLPTHNVEGNSGVFTTPMAYLANPAEADNMFGMPSVSATYAMIGEKDFESFVVTQNIRGNIELGYALERIGLGDWPDDVSAATAGAVNVDNQVLMHNFNTRLMLINEGGYGCNWMPAITISAHFKWNDGLDKIDDQTGGLCGVLGADHNAGVEFTAIASKTISDMLPRPLIVSAGIRNGDGIHTGLLGFAGQRRTTVEGSLIYFLADNLLIAGEYRQKSDLIDQCSMGGIDLIKAENDWFDVCLGYIVNERITIAGGYANFGNILNHREDNVWAIQLKYEL